METREAEGGREMVLEVAAEIERLRGEIDKAVDARDMNKAGRLSRRSIWAEVNNRIPDREIQPNESYRQKEG